MYKTGTGGTDAVLKGVFDQCDEHIGGHMHIGIRVDVEVDFQFYRFIEPQTHQVDIVGEKLYFFLDGDAVGFHAIEHGT